MKVLGKYTINKVYSIPAGADFQSAEFVSPNYVDENTNMVATRINKVSVVALYSEAAVGTPVADAPIVLKVAVDTDLDAVTKATTVNTIDPRVYNREIGFYQQRTSPTFIEHRSEAGVHVERTAIHDVFWEVSSTNPKNGDRIAIGIDFDASAIGLNLIIDIEVERVSLTAEEVIKYKTNVPLIAP